jgi:hypothetical protein
MGMRSWGIILAAALLAACGGKSADDYHTEARAALEGGDAPRALQLVDEAFARDAAKQDAAAAWRLEQVRLDALAKSGKGAEVTKELDRLAGTYPAQVTAPLYRSLADKAKAAGDVSGAIEVLAAADKRFPAEHASFVEAIDALKDTANLDPAQVQRLKALGYL